VALKLGTKLACVIQLAVDVNKLLLSSLSAAFCSVELFASPHFSYRRKT
jgi:hypothetical protein